MVSLALSPGTDFSATLLDRVIRVQDYSGIREILKCYVTNFGLLGASLWGRVEGGDETPFRLLLQSAFLKDGEDVFVSELPSESVAKGCVENGQAKQVSRKDGAWEQEVARPEYLQAIGCHSIVVVPIELVMSSEGRTKAAINLYSTRKRSESEFEEMKRAVQHFPAVYRSVQDRASLQLLRKVRSTLRRATREIGSDAGRRFSTSSANVLTLRN